MQEMQNKFTEEAVIFMGVLKWFILASFSGAIIGVAVAIFLKILNWSTGFSSHYSYYFLLLPAGLFLSDIIKKYLGDNIEGLGAEIEAVHKHYGKIKPGVVIVKLIATIITIVTGGSAGKEGPSAEIGAGVSSTLSDFMKLNDYDRKKLVICGISAGLASVFGTPISGAIYGIECLAVGGILYDVLLPSFIAGVTAYHVSSAMGISYFYNPIKVVPVFSETFSLKLLLCGIFFGLCSFFLIEMLHLGKSMSEKLKKLAPFKSIIGGIIIIGLTFIFSSKYLGLGMNTTESILKGGEIIWYAFIIKIIFTAITFNAGGSGGVVTPIFFIGASAGSLYAEIFHLDRATFAAFGALGLMAGATNTPIAASIMSMELFGTELAPYATIVCAISFLMTGHRSVYPYQLLSVKKSEVLQVELGKEMEKIEAKFKPAPESFSLIMSVLNHIKALKKK